LRRKRQRQQQRQQQQPLWNEENYNGKVRGTKEPNQEQNAANKAINKTQYFFLSTSASSPLFCVLLMPKEQQQSE